jgi:prephenate dehydrogenase
MGASIGLALRGSELGDVTLLDNDPEAVRAAVGRGAGRAWDGSEPADLVVVAVPPAVTGRELLASQGRDLARTYIHICSVQSQVQAEVDAFSSDPSAVIGSHPLAGREVSGPEGAVADLFVGRPWALCPTSSTSGRALDDALRLASLCGAVPIHTTPAAHDRAVAVLSHLPQIVSSALAGTLLARTGGAGALELQLSGPGLVDTTRLAASSSALWTQILSANAQEVVPPLSELIQALSEVARTLERLAADTKQERVFAEAGPATDKAGTAGTAGDDAAAGDLRRFLERGNLGRQHVPVKRGELAGAFAGVRVELADEPGQLAALLTAAGASGVNVEDVRVEHVPGRPRGVVELLVAPGAERGLRVALADQGWHVVSST